MLSLHFLSIAFHYNALLSLILIYDARGILLSTKLEGIHSLSEYSIKVMLHSKNISQIFTFLRQLVGRKKKKIWKQPIVLDPQVIPWTLRKEKYSNPTVRRVRTRTRFLSMTHTVYPSHYRFRPSILFLKNKIKTLIDDNSKILSSKKRS